VCVSLTGSLPTGADLLVPHSWRVPCDHLSGNVVVLLDVCDNHRQGFGVTLVGATEAKWDEEHVAVAAVDLAELLPIRLWRKVRLGGPVVMEDCYRRLELVDDAVGVDHFALFSVFP